MTPDDRIEVFGSLVGPRHDLPDVVASKSHEADDSEAFDEYEPVTIPITDVLDLHSFQARDVKDAVEAYLEEARRLGVTGLRIIHGRGIGVQREMVRTILARTPFVASFSDAPSEAGGWGATVVTLNH
jgi:dsDNA-specific endonuclease/ATPase MutS2